MLDYFLKEGFVKLKRDGTIKRLEKCPSNIVFIEFEDGKVKFFWNFLTQLVPIREPNDFENTKVITITPNTGIEFTNTNT